MFVSHVSQRCIYELNYADDLCHYIQYVSLFSSVSVSVSLIGGYRCTLLGCLWRSPEGRRDPPGPGGRHSGQIRGTQIQQINIILITVKLYCMKLHEKV